MLAVTTRLALKCQRNALKSGPPSLKVPHSFSISTRCFSIAHLNVFQSKQRKKYLSDDTFLFHASHLNFGSTRSFSNFDSSSDTWDTAATDNLEKKADSGDVVAMTELGRQYFDNERNPDDDDIISNKVVAEMWFLRAAEKNHAQAQYLLSLLLFSNEKEAALAPKDSKTDNKSSESTASNSEEVMAEIKEQRKTNLKRNKTNRKSKSNTTNANASIVTDSNSTTTATTAESLLAAELTDPRDAMYWLETAADNNNPFALCYLGNLHIQTYNTHREEYANKTSTANDGGSGANGSGGCGGGQKCGSTGCQCSGNSCSGSCCCKPKPLDVMEMTEFAHKAIECWERAGAFGSAEALYNLGYMYYDGVAAIIPNGTIAAATDSVISSNASHSFDSPADSVGTGTNCDIDHVHTDACNHGNSNASSSATTATSTTTTKGGENGVVITKSGGNGNSNSNNSAKPVKSTVADDINNWLNNSRSSNNNSSSSNNNTIDSKWLIEPDHNKSLVYFIESAELGDAAAQFWCGYSYMTGLNGTAGIDPLKAVTYLKQAAKSEHADANYYLSILYRNGLSSDPTVGSVPDSSMVADSASPAVSEEQADTSSVADSINSVNNNDVHHIAIEANQTLFLEYLHAACDTSHPEALFTMADIFLHGLEEYTETDYSKAVQYLEKASEAGHMEATVSLGALYYNGTGVKQDRRKAFEYYNIAAELGSEVAWRNLASMYYLGDGVPKSEETAKQIMSVIFNKK